MNWLKRIFKKRQDDFRPKVKNLYDFAMSLSEAKHEQRVMRGFIKEILVSNCSYIEKIPSKKILLRYNLSIENCNLLAWYLLEKYSEGKITINEDVQSK